MIRKRCASALELSRRRTKASFGACTGRDPRCFVKFYYHAPQSAAIRRLEEILADEDEAELARFKVEWLESFHNAVQDDALIAEFGT